MAPETATAEWARYDAAARRLTLTLHVQPNARRTAVAGRHGDALKIRIAAPPSDNRANDALTDFIAKTLGLPNSAVSIRHGSTGRRKVVTISPVDADAMLRLLSSAG